MKKNFCKVLAMVVAAIMMMSVAAFADIDTPEVAEEIATITISGLTTGEEATILVLNAGTDPATLADDDSNIIYIDQTTVADGKVTFTVDASAAKADEDGKKLVDIYSGYSSMTGDPFKLASVLISGEEEEIILYGDVNDDTRVNVQDSVILAQKIARQPVTINEKAADVFFDGRINVVDSVTLAQKIARIVTTLPVYPNA